MGSHYYYDISDQPRNILFENITVEDPKNPWYVNAQGITIKNNKIMGSTENIIVINKNSKDVTIDNVEATDLHSDKFFVSNNEYHTGIKDIQTGIKDVEVLNSKLTVSPDKMAGSAVISFNNIDGLTIMGNTIINSKQIPAFILVNITDFEEEDNRFAASSN